MKVLVVSSFNNRRFAPFITEQVDGLRKLGVECEYFGVVGRGIKGYLSNLPRLKRVIKKSRPDLIHAHYGLSGLLANMQRTVPVVTTYHGSDINDRRLLPLSRLSMALSSFNIFVSQKCIDMAGVKKNYALLPCGVNLSLFRQIPKEQAREKLGWELNRHMVLFAGRFDDKVKNSELARSVVSKMPATDIVELKGYSRETVPLVMSACDVLLMTSFSEGSPQVVKEAISCGCPVVSVDVGDVKQLFGGSGACFIGPYGQSELSDCLNRAMTTGHSFDGHSIIERAGLSLEAVSSELSEIYMKICGMR